MMSGLDKDGETKIKSRAILNARYNLKIDKDTKLRALKYSEFIRDPLG